MLTVECDALDRSPRRYWQFRVEPDHGDGSAVAGRLEAKIVETVRAHQIADVPVGASSVADWIRA